ncbi:MAG: hypothetical protein ACBR12_26595 [Microcoleus sp.]
MAYQIQYTLKNYCKWVKFAGEERSHFGIRHGKGDRHAWLFRGKERSLSIFTLFGQQFKVDWTIPDTPGIELRTIWEITRTNSNPRLISAFLNHDKKL